MRTQRLIAYTFAACLVSLVAGSAMADDGSRNPNAFLKGTYQLSNNSSCATSDMGFTQPDLQAIGSGQTQDIFFTGVITYDGHGHATSTDHGILLTDGPVVPGSLPVLTFEEDCSWTYAVNPDGSFSRMGSCTGAGESYTLSGIKFVGQIGVKDSVLIISMVEPVEQTLVGNGFSFKRICGGVGTEVRIHRQ